MVVAIHSRGPIVRVVVLLSMLSMLVGGSLWAQDTLMRGRIVALDSGRLALELERANFDVLEYGLDYVDVVVNDLELTDLQLMGYAVSIVDRGSPLRDRNIALRGTVPAGYPDLSQILAEMNLAETNFPNLCQVVDLTATYGAPTTFEGRSMYAIKVSDNVTVDEDEPAFLLVSAHHCREIVTPVIALDTLERLTTQYGIDTQITALVDEYEIWIAPVWNPDGYEYVFTTDNFWRKNRRVFGGGIGVDTNRNYGFGWTTACSGSTSPSSETYKGPSANSESETQTMIAWSQDRHFAKVLDFHSSGRETLYGYACPTHPWINFWQSEAVELSMQSGYLGDVRGPSADGEHYQWQIGERGSLSFLTETALSFQPSYASAQAEAATVWPGTLYFLERSLQLWGHVIDGSTGDPIDATIDVIGVPFPNGEQIVSGGPFGRYYLFAPAGNYDLEFTAPGYDPVQRSVTLTLSGSVQLDIVMGGTCLGDLDSTLAIDVKDYVKVVSAFGQSGGLEDLDGSGTVDIDDLYMVLPVWGSCP